MMETIRLGARLRAARKAAGFNTSKAFLKKYKVPASTYSQHESGARTPDEDTLRYYSKVFAVSFAWLKAGSGQPFGRSTLSKTNIMKEELLDLTPLKSMKKQTMSQIDQPLLTTILTDLINFHTANKSKQALSVTVKDAVKLYANVINHANENKSQIAKKYLTDYKNKYQFR